MAGYCILAIESNWRIRRLIRANLEPLGFRVCEAVGQRHSLACIREEMPDLILLDLDLPDAEAIGLLRNLRRQTGEQVPILVMSAEPLSQAVRQSGTVSGRLPKPFAAPTLLEQVQALVQDGASG